MQRRRLEDWLDSMGEGFGEVESTGDLVRSGYSLYILLCYMGLSILRADRASPVGPRVSCERKKNRCFLSRRIGVRIMNLRRFMVHSNIDSQLLTTTYNELVNYSSFLKKL